MGKKRDVHNWKSIQLSPIECPIRIFTVPIDAIQSNSLTSLSVISLDTGILILGLCIDFLVKFLREVTPYFRKASIISEVGWELQRAFLCPLGPGATSSPPAPRSPPRADTRYIPLQLTHLARNLKHPDPG